MCMHVGACVGSCVCVCVCMHGCMCIMIINSFVKLSRTILFPVNVFMYED